MLLHLCAAPILLLPRCLADRLPKLESVTLTVEGDPRPLCMGTVLYSLRAQLKGRLRSLHLDLYQSWIGADAAWRELGQCTMLTGLQLDCDKEVRHDAC